MWGHPENGDGVMSIFLFAVAQGGKSIFSYIV
jgi:hypothetical protein